MLIAKLDVPPCGWNSFDCYLGAIDEAAANANLDAFMEKLKPAGYEYFCLDAGWYADGTQELHEKLKAVGQLRHMNIDEYGRFVPSPVNFPHGLRALADRCHANGVKFGVHMMRGIPYFAVERNTPIKGTGFRARDIYDPDNNCQWCKYWLAADASHPGTLAFYQSEVEYLTNELNVDFIKLDDVLEHPDHVELFARAIDSVPRPVVLSLSPGTEFWPGHWARYAKCANMARISNDIWDYDKDNETRLRRWYEFENLTGPGMWADLDMIPLGMLRVNVPPAEHGDSPLKSVHRSNMTLGGKRTMMTIYALSCSPLIFGGDLPTASADDIAWVTNPDVLECNRNGVPARRVSFMRHLDIRKTARRGDSEHGWIGVFNTGCEPCHAKLSPEQLGFGTIPPLFELWDQYSITLNAAGEAEFYLPPNGCVFLKY